MHVLPLQGRQTAKPGTFPKSKTLSEIGEHGLEEHSHSLSFKIPGRRSGTAHELPVFFSVPYNNNYNNNKNVVTGSIRYTSLSLSLSLSERLKS
jgi:hypothetical protein